MSRHLLAGAVAGAAGTTVLNTITYLDMAVRGRPASVLPEQAAEKIAEGLHADLGDERTAPPRNQGIGALMGLLSGVAVGAAYGLFRHAVREVSLPAAAGGLGAAAAVAGSAPLVGLGLTDPRTWGANGWLTDLVPHLGYGLAAAGAYELAVSRR
ncbi:hypothetical protein Misp01_50650 [Microtetraspora sp. NBRC 13810]|nr:hypothetical protein Misp01_50650 [Microtetraspora sp. NBRC 13810]